MLLMDYFSFAQFFQNCWLCLTKVGGLACFAFPFFLRKKVSVVLVLAMGDFQVEDH